VAAVLIWECGVYEAQPKSIKTELFRADSLNSYTHIPFFMPVLKAPQTLIFWDHQQQLHYTTSHLFHIAQLVILRAFKFWEQKNVPMDHS
jgi:hypothetical protein